MYISLFQHFQTNFAEFQILQLKNTFILNYISIFNLLSTANLQISELSSYFESHFQCTPFETLLKHLQLRETFKFRLSSTCTTGSSAPTCAITQRLHKASSTNIQTHIKHSIPYTIYTIRTLLSLCSCATSKTHKKKLFAPRSVTWLFNKIL